MGVNAVPISGVVDANVGVNLSGSAALSFSSAILAVGGSAWTTSLRIITGAGGSLALSPTGIDSLVLTRSVNAVQLQADAAATSVAQNQLTLASGTGATFSMTAQSATTGTGGDLLLASGSGSIASGNVILRTGATERARVAGATGVICIKQTAPTLDLITNVAATYPVLCIQAGFTQSSAALSLKAEASGTQANVGLQFISNANAIYGYMVGGPGALQITGAGVPIEMDTQSGSALNIPAGSPTVHVCDGTIPASGHAGVFSIGIVTTQPTSSQANQVHLYNVAGQLRIMGKGGIAFYCAPQGGGTGAPVPIGYFGPAGELSEAKNGILELFDDFLLGTATVTATSTAIGGIGFQSNFTGTGAQAILSNTGADASHWGILTLNTGSTATGASGISLPSNSIVLGAGNDAIYEVLINIAALSTSIQEYTISAGFSDTSGQVTPVFAGVCFQYIRTTSVNWIMFSKVSGTTTSTATTVAVATGWTKLRIQKIGTNYQFFINGVSAGTLSTTLPTTNFLNVVLGIYSSVGTSVKTVAADYLKFSSQFGTAR